VLVGWHPHHLCRPCILQTIRKRVYSLSPPLAHPQLQIKVIVQYLDFKNRVDMQIPVPTDSVQYLAFTNQIDDGRIHAPIEDQPQTHAPCNTQHLHEYFYIHSALLSPAHNTQFTILQLWLNTRTHHLAVSAKTCSGRVPALNPAIFFRLKKFLRHPIVYQVHPNSSSMPQQGAGANLNPDSCCRQSVCAYIPS